MRPKVLQIISNHTRDAEGTRDSIKEFFGHGVAEIGYMHLVPKYGITIYSTFTMQKLGILMDVCSTSTKRDLW